MTLPALVVVGPALAVRSTALIVVDSALVVRPTALTVVDPALIVGPTALTVGDPARAAGRPEKRAASGAHRIDCVVKRTRSARMFFIVLALVACGCIAVEWIVFLPTRRYYFPDYSPSWPALLLGGLAWGAGAGAVVVLGRRMVAGRTRRDRAARGLCRACSYPLHDLAEGAACPECGGQRSQVLQAEGLERK